MGLIRRDIECAIRNTGHGWFVINDSVHQSTGVSKLTQNSDSLTLTYSFTGLVIRGGLAVNPDEYFGPRGYAGGASVGLSYAIIKLGRNGTPLNPSQIVSSSGNFWISGGVYVDDGVTV